MDANATAWGTDTPACIPGGKPDMTAAEPSGAETAAATGTGTVAPPAAAGCGDGIGGAIATGSAGTAGSAAGSSRCCCNGDGIRISAQGERLKADNGVGGAVTVGQAWAAWDAGAAYAGRGMAPTL